MPATNRQEACVFTLRSGIGLQADAGVAGGLAEPVTQLPVEFVVAGELIAWCERMHVRKRWPGDRDHLAGRVQLHRARTQRDHRAVQRQVFVGQAADVAQHLGLGVVVVEHRVRQEGAAARHREWQQRGDAALEFRDLRCGLARGEHRPQRFDVVACRGFVERDGDARGRGLAQVVAGVARGLHQCAGARAGVDVQRVEGAGADQRGAQFLQPRRQHRGIAGHAPRDALQPFGPVVDGVHARHHGRQHLRRADVRGGLLAADVLLAGLQGEPISRRAV